MVTVGQVKHAASRNSDKAHAAFWQAMDSHDGFTQFVCVCHTAILTKT